MTRVPELVGKRPLLAASRLRLPRLHDTPLTPPRPWLPPTGDGAVSMGGHLARKAPMPDERRACML